MGCDMGPADWQIEESKRRSAMRARGYQVTELGFKTVYWCISCSCLVMDADVHDKACGAK